MSSTILWTIDFDKHMWHAFAMVMSLTIQCITLREKRVEWIIEDTSRRGHSMTSSWCKLHSIEHVSKFSMLDKTSLWRLGHRNIIDIASPQVTSKSSSTKHWREIPEGPNWDLCYVTWKGNNTRGTQRSKWMNGDVTHVAWGVRESLRLRIFKTWMHHIKTIFISREASTNQTRFGHA